MGGSLSSQKADDGGWFRGDHESESLSDDVLDGVKEPTVVVVAEDGHA